MHPAAAPLLDALRARGDAACLALEDREVSAAAILAAVEHAVQEAEKLPLELTQGDVVGLRGRHAALRLAAPLAAWSLGLCTQLLSDREPDASVSGMLAAAGARCLLDWREPGVWSLLPLQPKAPVELPTGTLLSTSGSSGTPKLVHHELEQHIASARGAAAFLELGPDDRMLLSLPTYHAGGLGMVFRALLSGAVLCVPAEDTPLAEALVRFAPTQISLVATQLARLLEDDATRAALCACRTVLMGGGPIPAALRERALDAGVPLAVGYGATETSAFVAASRDPEVVRRPQSVGQALPQREVHVDAHGEIRVGGPTLFSGYLVDGEIEPARDEAGLWATGDVGRLEDGVLFVTGRRDRMFISGGENVQPEEIEAALLAIDDVAAAVVVPVADAEYGARPVAFVAGDGLDAARLDAALRAVLPGFKTPDVYYRMPPAAMSGMKP
ncbi:MAG: AMP-binding protein, partial [Planctomycetota bacterium]|nr:AMP-binding protein [Planctomycetota bacterium]